MTRAVDLFAGPGGWDVAADRLNLETDGIEWDAAAVLTRAAAGHKTLHDDVTTWDFSTTGYDGLIASPPCQSFSAAGKRKGLEDPRGQLVYEVMRYTRALQPRWIACEQVPGVLPIWQQFAAEMEGMGYSTWTGLLYAEQYGVPQTRKRAILIASLDRKVTSPTPTHSKYHARTPERLDEGVQKWVSMAEALNVANPSLLMRSNYGTGGDARKRGERLIDQPAPTVTSKIGRNKWIVSAGITGEGRPRPDSSPAPSITGGGTAYWLEDPGHWGNLAAPTARVTVQEAGVLQSFPVDYPWQGGKTKQYQQVGNAIPPLLAEAILGQVL